MRGAWGPLATPSWQQDGWTVSHSPPWPNQVQVGLTTVPDSSLNSNHYYGGSQWEAGGIGTKPATEPARNLGLLYYARVQESGIDNAQRQAWGQQDSLSLASILPELPDQILVVNSASSGAYRSLCADASKADVVAVDFEWAPDKWGSDNPISVMQLAFPQSRTVYVVQVERLDRRLPPEVQMMLVNPEVFKIGFATDVADKAKLELSGIAVTRDSLLDVQGLCTDALGLTDGRQSGLGTASTALLGFVMDKDKRLACSNWAKPDLSAAQVRYAALDAWVTLRLYYYFNSW